MDAESFTGIYKEIARAISVDVAVEMYNLFRGQQIIFPQRLYDQDFVITYVKENYNGHNIRELSHMFNYALVRSGRVRSIRIGHQFRIPREAVREFLDGTSV